MTSAGKERVGIVGVGRMGLAMLKHLVKHGYGVTACDLDGMQLAKAREAGAATADSPAALARSSDFVILGVGYTDEVNAVVHGDSGLLATLRKGSIVAISSTVSPATVQAIEAAAQPRGIGVLDAPICRGPLGGRRRNIARHDRRQAGCGRARPGRLRLLLLRLRASRGGRHGQVGKTMNNLLLWINSVGLIEAGRLAETTGIDLVKLREALQISSGASAALKRLGHDHLHLALKDMQVVAEMTDKAGLSLPVTGAVKELVKEARRIKAANPPNWTGSKAAAKNQKN